MIVLYTTLLLVLGTAGFLIRRRAASLERKYAGVVKETHALLKDPLYKEGNSNRSDPYQTAKRHYLLGQMVQRKEKLEGKHYFWEGLSEKFRRAVAAVRGWKGRKLPYLLGAIDVVSVMTVLEYLGYGEHASPRALLQVLSTWLNV
jgi:hypothetical protein